MTEPIPPSKHQGITRLIAKCYQYSDIEPEACLTFARKTAEAVCRCIFLTKVGDPGRMMLDELIKQLARKGLLPGSLVQPFSTVQKYGNFAAHSQGQDEPITSDYTVPCVEALRHISQWFFLDFLKQELPSEITVAWRNLRVRASGQPLDVRIASVNELLTKGWTMEQVIKDTMQIDYDTLPGLIPNHEGEYEQWVSIVTDHPETVRLLVDHQDRIVGYWHIIPLFPREFKKLRRAELMTTDITSDMICMLELPGTYDVYFLILTLLTEYRHLRAIRLLFESFLDSLESFAEAGIFFRNFCTDAYTPMGEAICRSFGMRLISTHPDRGSIYSRKVYPFPNHALFSRRPTLRGLYAGHFEVM